MTREELDRLCADGQQATDYLRAFLALPQAKQELVLSTLMRAAIDAERLIIEDLPAQASTLRESAAALLLAGQVLAVCMKAHQGGSCPMALT